ncbi:MAG TPA: DoxX family protein [Dehalococcoidia bacterium]|nr:DoxX family protein [Dehalococcoidia bacterium]
MSYPMQATKLLWMFQVLLGLFFALGSGAPKLLTPIETLPLPLPLPGPFVLFIGVAEVLGGIGLILPGLVRIRPGLTPLAASGLLIITIGAMAYQLAAGEAGNALFAVVMTLLLAFVAVGRWRLAPLRASSGRSLLQPAA